MLLPMSHVQLVLNPPTSTHASVGPGPFAAASVAWCSVHDTSPVFTPPLTLTRYVPPTATVNSSTRDAGFVAPFSGPSKDTPSAAISNTFRFHVSPWASNMASRYVPSSSATSASNGAPPRVTRASEVPVATPPHPANATLATTTSECRLFQLFHGLLAMPVTK